MCLESKELKQLIRNVIDPSKSLGHSDKPITEKVAMSRAKNVVDATGSEDGPINTLDDKVSEPYRGTRCQPCPSRLFVARSN